MALGLAGVPSKASGPFTGKTPAETKTRLGLYAAPQGNFGQSTKNPTVTVGSDPKTRLGLGAYSRGPLGNTTKTGVSTTYYDYSTDALTFTGNSYVVARDQVIDYAGIEIVPVTYDYEIIQGGQVISYNTDALTLIGRAYNVEQQDPNHYYVNYDSKPITFTSNNYTVVQPRLIHYTNKPALNLSSSTYSVIPGVLGEKTLSNADILSIWRDIKIDGLSPYEILKYVAAVILGKVEGGNTTLETFKAPATGVVRYKSSVDSNGNRQSIELL